MYNKLIMTSQSNRYIKNHNLANKMFSNINKIFYNYKQIKSNVHQQRK